MIAGEEETLIRDGYLEVLIWKEKPPRLTIKGNSEFLSDLKLDEKVNLSQIREIFERLNSDEVIFFIYFNPYIPNDIKEYFISKSEMEKSLILQK